MTAAILQERQVFASGGASAVSLAFSAPVTGGSAIHVASTGGGDISHTYSDGVNAYATLDHNYDVSDNQSFAHGAAVGAAAGATTVKVTFGGSVGYNGLWIREIGGVAAVPPVGHNLTWTGSVTSASCSATPSSQPALLSAIAATDATGSQFPTPSSPLVQDMAGGWESQATSAHRGVTDTGAQTATFTVGSRDSIFIAVAIFAASSTPAVPSWYSAISPGEWGTLPNSALTGSGVDEPNVYELILAWGGAWLNTYGVYLGTTFTAGTFLMLGPSGGHTDSSLNSVYAYGPLENDSPTWHRVRSTTSPAPQNVVTDANGNPVARHSYSGLAYLGDTVKKLLACGNFRYSDAGGPGQSLFDLTVSNPDGAGVQPWSQPAQAAASTSNALHDDIQIAQYDSANNRVWVWSPSGGGNGNDVGYYDVAGNTWSAEGFKSPLVNNGSNTSSCIDTTRGLWMMWGNGTLQFFQTNNGTANDFYAPTTTGTAPTIGTTAGSGIVGNGAMLYDPVDDQCIVWANSGQALWALKPPATSPYKGGNAWTWSSIAAAGATPGAENGTAPAASGFPGEPATDGSCHGTYGRFALYNDTDSGARGYLLLNRTSDAIYFYRPESAGSASTYNVSLAESASAADTLSAQLNAAASLAETASASDTLAAAASFVVSVSEAAAAGDAPSATVGHAASLVEAAAAADTPTSTAAHVASLSEIGTASDSFSATATFTVSITESGAASDLESTGSIYDVTVSETGTATDVVSAVLVASVNISESAAASDVLGAVGAYIAQISESVSAADALSGVANFAVSITESADAADALGATAVFVVQISEVAAAADSVTVFTGAPVDAAPTVLYIVQQGDKLYILQQQDYLEILQ